MSYLSMCILYALSWPNGSYSFGCSGQEGHDGGRVVGDHALDFVQMAALLVDAINLDEVGVLECHLEGSKTSF